MLKKNIQIKQTENRGEIFDRNGVLLASTIKSYSLFAHPKKIKEIDSLSKKLEEILSIPQNEIKSKLSKDTNFVWIKRNIIPREHQEIINLGEIGLQTKPENKRVYPHRELTSHIVGFDNIDGKGLSGIEKGLQNKLDSGENINLSVDIRIQNSVRNELIKTIQKFSAQSGSAIVMNITTGEILSMVNYPDFDPNFRDKILTKNQFNNATQGVFEMGSTFKPITMAIGLDKNIIDLEMLFDVSQPIKLGKYIINDFTPYKGKLNVKGIIVKSSNIGAAKIAQLIGKKNQIEYFKKFGFFDEIDLDGLVENNGILYIWNEKNLKRNSLKNFFWKSNVKLLTDSIKDLYSGISNDLTSYSKVLFIKGEKSNYILDNDWDNIISLFPKAKISPVSLYIL